MSFDESQLRLSSLNEELGHSHGAKTTAESHEEVHFEGYVAFGCMGEFYAASYEEWKKVVASTNKIACVFGAASQNTAGVNKTN